ncbi:MAG: response regulator transcription factor [Burkholderiales bacterium]|nr:response regulator transcription factor [Pseudomonadota bacterium]MCC7069527.1 response regulator transcription factor [Burkholderiales bacterium]MCZ2134211.1 response regulator transcription factor [Burkholderiales bacterium]
MTTAADRPRLLLVEDDAALAQALALGLSRRGFDVAQAGGGANALERVAVESFAAIVLDLTLPDIDGLDVLRSLRARGVTTPILVLTARGTVGDRVHGLRQGADDYLPKPFDLDELEARLHSLIRRVRPTGGATLPERLEFGPLAVDTADGVCYAQGRAIELSSRERAMLCALLARPRHAVTRERLWDAVFADAREVQSDAIEVVAYRLRKKLAGLGVEIAVLRGVGYLIRDERR